MSFDIYFNIIINNCFIVFLSIKFLNSFDFKVLY